jgi:N4-gp56 family major capsid protein
MAGQLWVTNSLGGYMSAAKLSKKLRMVLTPMCKFRQFSDVKDASQGGKHRGATFHWNVYSTIATDGGTLTETNTMPESNFTITQGTLTITEAGNSVPYTSKLDNLSEHPVTEIINKVLKYDARNFFDTQAHAQFILTALIAAPASGTSTTAIALTTDTVATQTSTIALRKGHIVAIVDTMKERNIPAYTGDDYYAIAHPTTFTTLRNDLEGVHQYTTEGFQMIKNGEIGKYNNCRFVEQSHIAKELNVTGVTDWAFFFGSDTVAEAIAVPEEIRGKIPTDFGRSKGIAWYYLGGFGIVHSGASSTTDQCRIVKWDSAT